MFIDFKLPQDGVEGDITAYDADGKEVKVARIVYTPYFFSPGAITPVLYASLSPGAPDAKKKAVVSQRAAVVVSGRQGRIRFQDRTHRVTPLCEESDDNAAAD
jgi:hypothetical protein